MVRRMGIGDLAGQGKEFLDQHDEQVDAAVEKGGDVAKERLPGHDDQIDQAVDRAQGATGGGDTVQDADPAESAAPPPAEGQ